MKLSALHVALIVGGLLLWRRLAGGKVVNMGTLEAGPRFSLPDWVSGWPQ